MFQRFLAHALCRTLEIGLTLIVLVLALHFGQTLLVSVGVS